MLFRRFIQCTCVKNWALQWRHNGSNGVSNHQPHDYLLNRLFRRRSKKTPKLPSLAVVRGIHRWPVNSPHKWSVTRKMFPFDDVITDICLIISDEICRVSSLWSTTDMLLSNSLSNCTTIKYLSPLCVEMLITYSCVNSSLPGQNSRHFVNDNFRRIFVNEMFWILIEISVNLVRKGSIDNDHALVYIMAWRRKGDKPISESVVTRNIDAYMRHQGEMNLNTPVASMNVHRHTLIRLFAHTPPPPPPK